MARSTGSATTTINRPVNEVWTAIADITRMGEWSPECTGGRWTDGATGPAVGATFTGDNEIKVLGRTVKKWSTTSAVTIADPGTCFEFVVEGYTTWRYDFAPAGAGTQVTETFSYQSTGFQGFLYGTVLQRPRAITRGMNRTLGRVKAALEA